MRWVAYLGLMLAMPLIVVTWSRRLHPRAARALAQTFLATWIGAAIAFYICFDFDSPGTWFTFAFLVLPCTIVPIAAVVFVVAPSSIYAASLAVLLGSMVCPRR